MARYMVRQGDVLLERIAALPEGLNLIARDSRGRIVVEEGEVTGHYHAIADVNAVLYQAEQTAAQYLEVLDREVSLTHDEHATIMLPPGVYVRRPQREYFEGNERRVLD